MKSIYEELFDHTVRIGCMWPFPVGPLPSILADELETSEHLPPELEKLTARWSEAEREELFTGENSADDAFEELCAAAFRNRVSGWIGYAETPVFTPHEDGNGATFSWGHYRRRLLFSTTAEGLLRAAIDWGKVQYLADMAKGKATA